jgi:hypothetical protein
MQLADADLTAGILAERLDQVIHLMFDPSPFGKASCRFVGREDFPLEP